VFDIWAVRQSYGDRFFIWEYNSRSIIGYKVFGVPVEDFIFFLVLTPVFIISIYESIKFYIVEGGNPNALIILSIIALPISWALAYKYAIRSKILF